MHVQEHVFGSSTATNDQPSLLAIRTKDQEAPFSPCPFWGIIWTILQFAILRLFQRYQRVPTLPAVYEIALVDKPSCWQGVHEDTFQNVHRHCVPQLLAKLSIGDGHCKMCRVHTLKAQHLGFSKTAASACNPMSTSSPSSKARRNVFLPTHAFERRINVYDPRFLIWIFAFVFQFAFDMLQIRKSCSLGSWGCTVLYKTAATIDVRPIGRAWRSQDTYGLRMKRLIWIEIVQIY